MSGARRDYARRQSEVAWGTEAENPILERWMDATSRIPAGALILKSRRFHDFDFAIFDAAGLPLCYIEIKRRRTDFKKYGDAIFPLRKHDYALELAKRRIPLIGVTEYGCGTIVQVNLGREPDAIKDVERWDRPGESVPHVFYGKKRLKVVFVPPVI